MVNNDEYEITASTGDGSRPPKIWKRWQFEAAVSVAEAAVQDLGYDLAQVINVHSGQRSNPIHVVVVINDEEPPTVRYPQLKTRHVA